MQYEETLANPDSIETLPQSLKDKIKILEAVMRLDGKEFCFKFYNCRFGGDWETHPHSELADILLIDEESPFFTGNRYIRELLIVRPCNNHVESFLQLYNGEIWRKL